MVAERLFASFQLLHASVQRRRRAPESVAMATTPGGAGVGVGLVCQVCPLVSQCQYTRSLGTVTVVRSRPLYIADSI